MNATLEIALKEQPQDRRRRLEDAIDEVGEGTTPLRLASGDTLVLYTDGLTEARDGSDEEYGAQRLRRVVADASPDTPRRIAARILVDLDALAKGRPRHDDLTLMVMRRS